jgi:hypothetical protein
MGTRRATSGRPEREEKGSRTPRVRASDRLCGALRGTVGRTTRHPLGCPRSFPRFPALAGGAPARNPGRQAIKGLEEHDAEQASFPRKGGCRKTGHLHRGACPLLTGYTASDERPLSPENLSSRHRAGGDLAQRRHSHPEALLRHPSPGSGPAWPVDECIALGKVHPGQPEEVSL